MHPSWHRLRDLIDSGIPILLDEVEDPVDDRPPWQTMAEDQAAQCSQAGRSPNRPNVNRVGEPRVPVSRVRVATNWTKSVELAGANNIGTNIGILRVAAIWRANADLLCLASSKGDIGTAP